MQKNKFTTYLLYAIGEIVLVVIGILIAVSLNNWNQNRKNTAEFHETLRMVHNNLNADLQSLNLSIKQTQTFQQNLKELEEKGITFPPDTLLHRISIIHRVIAFRPVTFGYEKLSNLSTPNKVPDSLIAQITSYYTSYASGLNDTSYEDLALYSLNQFRDYMIGYGFPLSELGINKPKDLNILSEIIRDETFIGIIRNTNYNRSIQLMGLYDAVEKASSCKNRLETYFTKNQISY